MPVLRSANAGLTNIPTISGVAVPFFSVIGPSDEAIVPAMTFVAESNVVELIGANLVVVNMEPNRLLISIEKEAQALSPATKIIMPIHLFGQMVNGPDSPAPLLPAQNDTIGDRFPA